MTVRIVDPKHPHFPEHGELTGEVITMPWGEQITKMSLAACVHGTGGCYVSKGQIAAIESIDTRRRAAREARR